LPWPAALETTDVHIVIISEGWRYQPFRLESFEGKTHCIVSCRCRRHERRKKTNACQADKTFYRPDLFCSPVGATLPLLSPSLVTHVFVSTARRDEAGPAAGTYLSLDLLLRYNGEGWVPTGYRNPVKRARRWRTGPSISISLYVSKKRLQLDEELSVLERKLPGQAGLAPALNSAFRT